MTSKLDNAIVRNGCTHLNDGTAIHWIILGTAIKDITEIRNWCRENTESYYETMRYSLDDNMLKFTSELDVVLFKLRWL